MGHQEVASGPFCLLVNSPWLLVFALNVFFFFILIFNLNCWFGIHISWSLDLVFFCLFCGLIISLKNWFRDLLRELNKKYEILLMVLFLIFFLFLFSEVLLFVSFFWAAFHSFSSPTLGVWPGEGFYIPDLCELTFANTLLLSNAAVSLGGAFVSLEISCSFLIFFSLFSFILSLVFFVAIAFMGYVLPFGQMSFWGATVITNLLSPFPSLIEWVSGGYCVHSPTLKRFFIFHFQFPFLLCGFTILHLFYLHFYSSNNPLRNSTNNKIPFFPFILLKDFFGLILVLCLYFLQTHFGVSSLSHPDNALEACALLTPLHIVPEWYFLC